NHMKEDKIRTYWQDLSELKSSESSGKPLSQGIRPAEFQAPQEDEDLSRRDFLKWMGFSLSAVSLAACETPVRKAIPYLNKPEKIEPGTPNYYASTYFEEGLFSPLVVKTREGRPIKLAPNPLAPDPGSWTARVEASVLDLYDGSRHSNPLKDGKKIDLYEADKLIMQSLRKLREEKKELTIISHSLPSPSSRAALDLFKKQYPNTRHVVYDPISYSAALDVNEHYFGLRAFPSYRFDKAKTIVSFGADFLGTWLAPGAFSSQFAKGRKLNKHKIHMSHLCVVESLLSLTGANADLRIPIHPTEGLSYLSFLFNILAETEGLPLLPHSSTIPSEESANLKKLAKNLLKQKGKSLIVCGYNDKLSQNIVHALNLILGNYGRTLEWSKPYVVKQGDDKSFANWIERAKKGKIGGVIFWGTNPLYDRGHEASQIQKILSECSLSISTALAPDETSAKTSYVIPDTHYLESWHDVEPTLGGALYLTQPAISPVFSARQVGQSLLRWSGRNINYLSFLKRRWQESLAQQKNNTHTWHKALAKGFSTHTIQSRKEKEPIRDVFAELPNLWPQKSGSNANKKGFYLLAYESIALGSGSQSNNPWLQELPDPITKVCWENCLSLSPEDAQTLGVYTQDVHTSIVEITWKGFQFRLPAIVQPGQKQGVVGLALGYGRKISGKVGTGRGEDIYPLQQHTYKHHLIGAVKIRPTGDKHALALMQTQSTHMNRHSILQEASLSDYRKNPAAGRFHPEIATSKGKVKPGSVSLWEGHNYPKHHWGMVIDLNSCTGCQACVVACQAENNIPVVGKKEVSRRRDMHWLRIDRYYSAQSQKPEIAGQNPQVSFQPMMCQHCNNAPCETVCPVAATTHSSEGLNQMAYNRCVGTRYCANNCPYKVRRFNWFKYHDNQQFPENTSMNHPLSKMVLNPDVTVRSRGVMEKCTFCIQRIQHGKLQAKRRGETQVRSQEVQSACSAACTTGAIQFGDLKNTESPVAQILLDPKTGKVKEQRAYHVLEELNVSPNVWYLSKIRNKEQV
ncbi:MAG: 4Fe-4S dicluster domain-containing protein, partial [Cytophagales bacterium]|nr:4Fe-4S dicluster domain-containing protein [Cytophagales bacterium]